LKPILGLGQEANYFPAIKKLEGERGNMSTLQNVIEFGDLSGKHLAALVNKLGGLDNLKAVLRGQMKITLEEVAPLLADRNGRLRPQRLHARVCDPNRELRFDKPVMATEVDYATRLYRLHTLLDINTGVTAAAFQLGTERLLADLVFNPQVSSLANGCVLPLVLPELKSGDLGKEVEIMATALGNGYEESYLDRKFVNRLASFLISQVAASAKSRHEALNEARQRGPVIALHFPCAMQGFSVQAAREQIHALPEGFALSGTDTLVAGIMYPELFESNRIPGLDMAALDWMSTNYSLSLVANNGKLALINRDCLGTANGSCSSGLLFFRW
jgi:hypothetical protein